MALQHRFGGKYKPRPGNGPKLKAGVVWVIGISLMPPLGLAEPKKAGLDAKVVGKGYVAYTRPVNVPKAPANYPATETTINRAASINRTYKIMLLENNHDQMVDIQNK